MYQIGGDNNEKITYVHVSQMNSFEATLKSTFILLTDLIPQ
jgi:hypothetical protein